MIFCKELNRHFSTKEKLFAELKANKTLLAEAKKAAIKESDPFITRFRATGYEAVKSERSLTDGGFVYPVINTTWWLDSHKDLHIQGIWDKSAKEQNGKTYYIINHDLSIGKVISYPKDVDISVKEMLWKDIGYDYEGYTQCLIFKCKITERSNRDAVLAFEAGEEIQNSVRMLYVSLDLAINSDSPDYKDEKAVWEKYAPKVVNKEALEDGYFWPIYEAKIYKEGSAVLFGSNEATPVLYEQPKHTEPPKGTHTRAGKSTRIAELNKLSSLLKTIQ